jgi:hypothetical protein
LSWPNIVLNPVALHRTRPHQIAFGRFDFHHVGAHVGEQAAAVRASDGGREIEDPQAVERPCHVCHGVTGLRG